MNYPRERLLCAIRLAFEKKKSAACRSSKINGTNGTNGTSDTNVTNGTNVCTDPRCRTPSQISAIQK